MKLQLRLLALVLVAFMSSAYAAPEKASAEGRAAVEASDDPIGKFASNPNKSSASEEVAGDLILQAMSLLGVAYRFGGTSPTSGLDCSGFIQYIFKKSLRVSLPRTAAEMAHTGRGVDRSELAPGDLVFFNTRGFANSHVGMYMGNNKFIHAPRTGKSVEVVSMSSAYWAARYNGARRVSRGGANVADYTDKGGSDESSVRSSRPVAAKKADVAEPATAVKCRRGKHCKAVPEAEPKGKGKKGKAAEVEKGSKGRAGKGKKEATKSSAGRSSKAGKSSEKQPIKKKHKKKAAS
ncbi:C40 family peptidase [Crenobacter sp. SG2303]|uniref:C40 family peptidase n=1 Tax=Crenobacter oryzisoli TaxID=3056844 RepID=A0ABT7XQV8_9NEIS|nr:C40 family peptidase [Crenobacter sp. SG2303]MDN0076182.1 C40 family peptidase [Crenobacter sp. SG2303]